MLLPLRRQDPSLADALCERFAPLVARILRNTLGPHARLDRPVEAVLLCVFWRGRRLRRPANLTRFVLRTTVQIAQIELRSARSPRSSRPSLVRVDGQREALLRFYRILDSLTAADRIAFVLHHFERFEVRAIASAMGSTSAQVTRAVRRTQQKVFVGIEADPILRRLRSGA